MERLTAREPSKNMAYLAKVRPNEQEVEASRHTCECIMESWDRLAAYEDTGLEPSEVAALRARCEAAEADLESVADGATICGVCDQMWCSACDGYNQFKWRGPQEGATAHERV